MYQNLHAHPNLGSSLVLLKSPDWYHTFSLYPVSTLAANCNLIVEASSSKMYMNVRRCIPGVDAEVYVVRGRTTGSSDAGRVVKIAVDAARTLVGGEKDGRLSRFWDGLGVCTWESFGKESKSSWPYFAERRHRAERIKPAGRTSRHSLVWCPISRSRRSSSMMAGKTSLPPESSCRSTSGTG